MSNHYHVALFVDIQQGKNWNDMGLLRWHWLFKGNVLLQRFARADMAAAARNTGSHICSSSNKSRENRSKSQCRQSIMP
jgi:hypothetical protein